MRALLAALCALAAAPAAAEEPPLWELGAGVAALALPDYRGADEGRGYLLPLGCAILAVMFANVAVIIGWGSLFPWAVPGLFAGMGSEASTLSPASYSLVILTGLAGIAATYLWWQYADQNR